MQINLKIGDAARASGLSVRTIRFYEEVGLTPPPRRTEAGYRAYSRADLRRLRLARRARLLGVPLQEMKSLLEEAMSLECRDLAARLLALIDERQAAAEMQIAALRAFQSELDGLARDVRQALERSTPGETVSECEHCSVLDTDEEVSTT